MTAQDWINQLGLKAHPEGGYYRETYRNPSLIQPSDEEEVRNLATSIYFLLANVQKSHFHQLQSDELWYFHAGCAAVIHIFDEGKYHQEKLGMNLQQGESLQVLLPAGCVFAAEVAEKTSYILAGCMVNPGFDFKDFRMVGRNELLAQFPDMEALILSFSLF